MDTGNFEQARAYALGRLERDLPEGLHYHSPAHTVNDVVPATEAFAAGEGIGDRDLLLLRTAAWFHDVGFVELRVGHEAVGARLAGEVLPQFGYSAYDIRTVQAIIMATAIPQAAQSVLEQIMADADLDVLGRDDFLLRNTNLRRELAFYGQEFSDAQWFGGQLKFVGSHSYFTATARALRDEGQARNVEVLRRALAQAATP